MQVHKNILKNKIYTGMNGSLLLRLGSISHLVQEFLISATILGQKIEPLTHPRDAFLSTKMGAIM